MPPDYSMDDPGDKVDDGYEIISGIFLAARWDNSTNENQSFRACALVLNHGMY